MDFCFNNQAPIFLQLLEQLRAAIVAGTYTTGEKLPSVRELALLAKVNPNTVQKALAELEGEGLIFTERTNGKFVTLDKAVIARAKDEAAQQKVAEFLGEMEAIGISREETLEYIKSAK